MFINTKQNKKKINTFDRILFCKTKKKKNGFKKIKYILKLFPW